MEDEKNSSNVKLFLAGDVMLGRGIDQILPHPGNPALRERYVTTAADYVRLAEAAHGPIPRPVDHAYVWGDAMTALDRLAPDLRIVNLETAITASPTPLPKGINYRMHPRNAETLTAFKIDCCSLANNHVLDWGPQGLVETLDCLKRIGIATAGAGRDRVEAEAPAILECRRGRRVLVFGAATPISGVSGEWAAREDRAGIFLLDDLSPATVDALAARIAAARRSRDIVVFSLHWGGNWGYGISSQEIAFAHALIEKAGVDIVHGHSSHHAKAVEVHRGKLVLYGCGDFIDDYEGIGGHETFRSDLALAYVASVDTAAGGQLADLRILPFRIRKFRLERAPAEDTAWLRETLSRESAPVGTRFATANGDLKLVRQQN